MPLREWPGVIKALAVVTMMALGLAAALLPAQAEQGAAVLFQNVRIFDGRSDTLSGASNILIRDNKIEKISLAAITAGAAQTVVIDGGGRVLMPGLIDAHWHAMLIRPTPAVAIAGDVGYNNLLAAAEATDTLMRGFTTVRDVGGPSFGLKQAIDEGLVPGPRIYPSGAMITVTSGHGDFRQRSDLPRTIGGMLTRMEQIGGSMVADSPDEVRVRARATHAGGVPDQVDGGRRGVIALQSDRRRHLHRARIASRGRSGRELGHIRRRACLYAGCDPTGYCRWR